MNRYIQRIDDKRAKRNSKDYSIWTKLNYVLVPLFNFGNMSHKIEK